MKDAEKTLIGFIDDVWNAHRPERFPEHVSPQVRFHAPRGNPKDYAGYLAMAKDFLAAFPDLHFAVERAFARDAFAGARLVITGTNDGPFRGRPPTGKKVRVTGHPLCRVEDGKIVEFWQLFDELGMLHQLGHVGDPTLLGLPATPK